MEAAWSGLPMFPVKLLPVCSRTPTQRLVLWISALLSLLSGIASAATFTVVNTNDAGAGSLRWAITNANAQVTTSLIQFNLSGPGPHTIAPLSALALITSPVVIDGYSQPGASPNTLSNGHNAQIKIRLDGSLAAPTVQGLKLNSAGCTIRGLAIVNFGRQGIWLAGQSDTIVVGNYIGIDVNGTTSAGNGTHGVQSSSLNARVGGSDPADRNVISGNGGWAFFCQNSAGNQVLGNYIGVDASGTLARPNIAGGLYYTGQQSSSNRIGAPFAGNIISAHAGHAILITNTPNCFIEGNVIGSDWSRTRNLGNSWDAISLHLVTNVRVGGTNAGMGNFIAYNGGNGVVIGSGTNNPVLGNSFYRNGGMAIDLLPAGPTPNDPGDADTGPNNLQNYPVITSATNDGASLMVRGSFGGSIGTSYRVGLYAMNACGDGGRYVGSTTFTIASAGNYSWSLQLPGADIPETIVAATATTLSGDTSEFSPCVAVVRPPINPPVITGQPADVATRLGLTVGFNVTVSGTGPFSHQWRFDGAPLADATNAALILDSVSASVVGGYDVVVANSGGSVTSRLAQLSLLAPGAALITNVPVFLNPAIGSNLVVQIGFSGGGPYTFQWRLNGVNMEGQTNETLRLSNIQATNSGSYSLVIDSPFGSVETDPTLVVVQLPGLPFADNFASAEGLIFSTSFVGRGNNSSATSEADEPFPAGKEGGHSLWLRWVGPTNGVATFRTAGSAFDTLLAVYTGSEVNALTEVASDDDSGPALTSAVQFNVTAGQIYWLAVAGFGENFGEVVLSGTFEPSLLTLPEVISNPFDQVVADGGTAIFRVKTRNDAATYQWYRDGDAIPGATVDEWSLDKTGEGDVGTYSVRIGLNGRTIETAPVSLELVAAGQSLAGGRSHNKLRDAALAPPALRLPIVISETLALKGRAKSVPSVVRGYTGTQIFSTHRSTREPGEPNHCGVVGGSSKWIAFSPETNGVIYMNTDGSSYDTILAVYTGTGESYVLLKEVACDNNSGLDGRDSALSFVAERGTNYFVVVDGANGVSGTVKLNYGLLLPARLTVIGLNAGGYENLRVTGSAGMKFRIECSSAFGPWSPLFTTNSASATFDFTNPSLNDGAPRFYRALMLP